MEKTILYQNKKIFYHSYGNGRPVLLIHGFGEDGTIWHDQAVSLKNKFHLIIPDLPGTGRSEMTGDMSMEGLAEVIHAIIHEEKMDTCCVIGHSMGGYIALALAENYPNHVNGLGLFHSTAFADSPEKKLIREKGIEFIHRHGPNEFLKTTTPNLFSPLTQNQKPELISSFINQLPNFSPDSLVAYYRAMMARPGRTALLKNVKIPVLFISGEYDNAVPLQDSLKQCYLPEKCYFHNLKKSGHMGMIEESQEANRILDKFLLEI